MPQKRPICRAAGESGLAVTNGGGPGEGAAAAVAAMAMPCMSSRSVRRPSTFFLCRSAPPPTVTGPCSEQTLRWLALELQLESAELRAFKEEAASRTWSYLEDRGSRA